MVHRTPETRHLRGPRSYPATPASRRHGETPTFTVSIRPRESMYLQGIGRRGCGDPHRPADLSISESAPAASTRPTRRNKAGPRHCVRLLGDTSSLPTTPTRTDDPAGVVEVRELSAIVKKGEDRRLSATCFGDQRVSTTRCVSRGKLIAQGSIQESVGQTMGSSRERQCEARGAIADLMG